jgi:hypothetical protein
MKLCLSSDKTGFPKGAGGRHEWNAKTVLEIAFDIDFLFMAAVQCRMPIAYGSEPKSHVCGGAGMLRINTDQGCSECRCECRTCAVRTMYVPDDERPLKAAAELAVARWQKRCP